MPTTNPVPSTDPSDLLFNAGKLDEVVNGAANSFTDRLGSTRRTVAGMNADFDAQLADAESDLNVYRADAAASAAEALGYLQTIRATSYGAYASDPATDPLGNPPTVGDEYFNTTANLLKRWNGATWQASDISTANLAASSGSSLVGYDGGTVQDVLDGAKSLQDYAALRAYTGRAKRVYITGLLATENPAGIAGTFQYDPTDTTSADNGGTIIVGADGRRWKRDSSGPANVLWFGADPFGLSDSTAAFQAAINYCKLRQTAATGTLGGGFQSLHAPAGLYIVSGRLDIVGFNGFRIFGDGTQATNIVFTGDASNLFYLQTYLNCSMAYMTLSEGTVSGVPPLTYTRSATRTNLCFRFNGTSGGAGFQMDRVNVNSFALVFQTTDGTVNCDNHTYNQCVFQYNTDIWNNTNTNAVIWSFNECKAYYTSGTVFKNPGSTLRVNGGDWINPGDFILGNLPNLCTDLIFDGLRFESYQNIDPTSNPRLMVLSQTHTITFRNCTQRGGGSLAGKTTATLNGVYNIKAERCFLPGNWAATVGSSQDGITSSIVFDECDGVPNVVQTLVDGQGSRPLNIEYRRHRQSATGYVDRVFHGGLPSQSRALSSPVMQDMLRFEAVLNASSSSKSLQVFVVNPYILQFAGAEITWWNNSTNTCTIDIWADSTKTVKLATVNTVAAASQYQILEIPLSGVLARHQITSASNPLYVEVSAASNAGTCRANITLKFRQVN